MGSRKSDFRISRGEYEALGGDPWEAAGPAFEHVWGHKLADDERLRRFAQLTPGQRVMVPLSSLHAEVVNGGLCQYFYNSGSMLCQEALDGLLAVKARHSNVLARAMAIFPDGRVPRAREDRLLALYAGDRARLERELEAIRNRKPMTPRNVDWAEERIEKLLESLTGEYYRLEENHRTSLEHGLARRYVEKNLADFVSD